MYGLVFYVMILLAEMSMHKPCAQAPVFDDLLEAAEMQNIHTFLKW